jgi:hypothetical protein
MISPGIPEMRILPELGTDTRNLWTGPPTLFQNPRISQAANQNQTYPLEAAWWYHGLTSALGEHVSCCT